ncbi:hypothetical protein ARMGADRAFT_1007579 [Armillaria gallica]|uniref:Uncharacterized protein n=1 Tax=Armillaria gallica TaxID=47427 RepID=A0A2H3EC93_ARMGA|nr:hypothetical protein ARMGADRAFT_1007579 [Armillaria gallica]
MAHHDHISAMLIRISQGANPSKPGIYGGFALVNQRRLILRLVDIAGVERCL